MEAAAGWGDPVGAAAAKNRALYALSPCASCPQGTVAGSWIYGDQAAILCQRPAERGRVAPVRVFAVRGRTPRLCYRVEGPYRLKGAATHPVFLLWSRGVDRRGRLGDPVSRPMAGQRRRDRRRGPDAARRRLRRCWRGRGSAGKGMRPTASKRPPSAQAIPSAGRRARPWPRSTSLAGSTGWWC